MSIEIGGPENMTEMCKIGELIAADKYEHCTRDPIFLVQQKIRDYGYSEDYASDFEWFDNDRQEIVDERIAKRLTDLDSNYREIPNKYTKVCYCDRWEFVTCCFTREGAEAFIKRQAHNLKETRIWVDSLFRNAEMIAVREYLKSNADAMIKERNKG
jgi:hypothetical protein